MKILVVNGYVRQNKGDAALMSVLCRQLQKTFANANIKISSQENPNQYPFFEDWQNVGSLIGYCFDPKTSKINHLLRLAFSAWVLALLGRAPKQLRRKVIKQLPQGLQLHLAALAQADLVVSMGGGYLNGNKTLMAHASIYLILAPLRLAKQFGACVICAPCSMGPFATKLQRTAVTHVLKKVDLILTREKKTTKLLAKMSNKFPLVHSVDSGFLFDVGDVTDLRSQLNISPKKLLVGVTVRRWLDPRRQQAYEQAIAKTVDHITSRHKAVAVFIPQVTSSLGGDDDRITAKNVYRHIKHRANVCLLDQHYTHQQIKALYNGMDLIIGTRFHSVIFSLTSHVPALAIEYEHKTSGIMHDLGLDKWVVKIEEATPEILQSKIDELIAKRAQYKKHLKNTLPGYLAEAQKATDLMQQTYESVASPTPPLRSQS